MKKKVIIIGAGVIGLHCAFYLNEKGFEVEVLEALPENDETACSYGNCGLIVPSHFVPLASPAMLHSGLKMLFDRKSPVYLPVGRNIQHIPWFLKFMQAANQKQVNRVIPTLYKLNEESRNLYKELSLVSGNKTKFEHSGMLMVSATEKGFEEEAEVSGIAVGLGIETTIFDAAALKKAEPEVNMMAKGAVFYKSDGQIDPVEHMRWLKTYLKNQGVVFHFETTVREIGVSKGKIIGIKTNVGEFSADEYVLATGAFSSVLANSLGISIPVISGKGYSIDFPKSELKLRTPLILTEAKVAITPFDNRIRLGSGMEFNGKVGEVRLQRVQAMLDNTSKVLPQFGRKNVSELKVWEGLRPVTPSGFPYIGRTKKYPELLVAAGHAMMGVSLGPVTGKIVSQLIAGEPTGFDMHLLHPGC
jgi:D-amino-acid dehydrogenase